MGDFSSINNFVPGVIPTFANIRPVVYSSAFVSTYVIQAHPTAVVPPYWPRVLPVSPPAVEYRGQVGFHDGHVPQDAGHFMVPAVPQGYYYPRLPAPAVVAPAPAPLTTAGYMPNPIYYPNPTIPQYQDGLVGQEVHGGGNIGYPIPSPFSYTTVPVSYPYHVQNLWPVSAAPAIFHDDPGNAAEQVGEVIEETEQSNGTAKGTDGTAVPGSEEAVTEDNHSSDDGQSLEDSKPNDANQENASAAAIRNSNGIIYDESATEVFTDSMDDPPEMMNDDGQSVNPGNGQINGELTQVNKSASDKASEEVDRDNQTDTKGPDKKKSQVKGKRHFSKKSKPPKGNGHCNSS